MFWKALPDHGFGVKGKGCHGDKNKQRITVAFFVSAAGTKEKPVVVWKSKKPQCLERFDKSVLPVQYFSQAKSWMTGEILESILTKLNHQLSYSGRSILLLMDNTWCHPVSLKEKFSNIKIVFVPANTTSRLQPLDLGIIQNFKVHYRALFLRYILLKIEECETASDVVQSVNILIAIRWVAQTWSKVKVETICKCFRKAGFLDAAMDVVARGEEGDDPFLEDDTSLELQGLIDKTMQGSKEKCMLEEYVTGDSDLAVCMEKIGRKHFSNK